ncbi:MAG: M24 family metallopeptidase [Deferribacterales bacterium]
MNSRILKLRGLMRQNGVGCLFVTSMSDIYYLTGFTGSTAFLFVTGTEALFLTDGRYEEQVKEELTEGIEAEIVKNYQESLQACAGKYKDITVTYSCGLYEYEMIKDHAEKTGVDKNNMISALRMVKDESELALIRDMYRAAHTGFVNAFPSFVSGVTEDFWAAELEKQMKLAGAKTPSFETITASGYRGAMPHGAASRKVVEKNDAVVLDYGCRLSYCSDVTRLIIAGENEKAEMIADIVYSALKKASDAVRPGAVCCDIDKIARHYIESKGFGKYFNHSLGHGVGIDVHEKPTLNSRDTTVLEPGMVVTIEPGIYLPGELGVRLEDTVAVTDSGFENLAAVFDKYVYKSK